MSRSISTVTVFLLALASFSAKAQMAERVSEHPWANRLAAPDAVSLTREMTARLQLNEGQFLKLLPLNRIKLARLSRINHQYENDEAGRAAKTAELEAQYEKECSRILTPSQLSQLQQQTGPPAASGNGLG